jgi:hydrogenase/urease accessory protein HupE
MWTYAALGVEHILLGFDHLLFVLALLLLVRGTKLLVLTITAFTVAHSITLGAAVLGFVSIPIGPVEAIIALSIVFVAQEIIKRDMGRPSLTARAPWLVSFSFGLLHGLGFAGALSDIGLPQQSIPLALLFFNVGVEIGQLAFVFACILTMILFRRYVQKEHILIRRAPAYGIGALAAFWTLERFSSLL